MIDIRLPNINGKTESEQLTQIKSYLYQFAGQLQWALSNVGAGGGGNVVLQKSGTGSVATKEDPTFNFNELKGLIIKSADIVEAYAEKIDNILNLKGNYVAQSDFGTFKEETKNTVSATDKQLRQDLVDKQSIYDDKGNIRAELLVNGHIYSGIIEYAKDGEAIVGIEIGQTTTENGNKKFNQFARFTANKLSFFAANAVEVAYISDYKLHITNAEIGGNLKINGFVFDTSSGIALRWEG